MGSQSGWSLSVSVQQILQWGDTEAKAISSNKHCLGLKVSARDLSGQLINWELSRVILVQLQLKKAGETAQSVKSLLGKQEALTVIPEPT